MNNLIKDNMKELHALCVQYKVGRLDLFGSAAKADFLPDTGDLDFLVEFQELPPGEYFDTYFDLLEDLHNLFNRPIDLIMTRAIRNRYFLQSVNQSKKTLYAA